MKKKEESDIYSLLARNQNQHLEVYTEIESACVFHLARRVTYINGIEKPVLPSVWLYLQKSDGRR